MIPVGVRDQQAAHLEPARRDVAGDRRDLRSATRPDRRAPPGRRRAGPARSSPRARSRSGSRLGADRPRSRRQDRGRPGCGRVATGQYSLDDERSRACIRQGRAADARRRGGVHAPRRDDVRALQPLRRGRRRARGRPARRAGPSRADAEHARGRIGRVSRHRRAAERPRDRAPRHHRGDRAARHAARGRRRAPVLALGGPAHHDARPLPLARRAAAVRGAPRARVRHARARRGAGARSRDARDGEPAGRAARPPGALGELAVLARRGDRARLDAHRDLREHAPLRASRRASRPTRTTSRWSARWRKPA